MKTVNTIQEQVAANRDAWFAYRHNLAANLATLESLYSAQIAHIDGTPAQTIVAYVKAVGYETVIEVIASMANRSAWDGRISADVKSWAQVQENAWDEAAADRLCLYSSKIHMAHLNQLARALMEYQPIAQNDDRKGTL